MSVSAPTRKPIIVLGASGNQGGAVIRSILASNEKDNYTILAVTRDPDSPNAKALIPKSPNVKVIQGNLDNCAALFGNALQATNNTPIHAVFSVQQAVQDGATPANEERRGKDLINISCANDVKVFVYSSCDRGGDVISETKPTYVPHFASKYNVEKHLKMKTQDGRMTYTILRPVAYMDNCAPDANGKMFMTWFKVALRPEKALAVVAAEDVGWFAAQALLHPEDLEYKKRAMGLAGDELTFKQANDIFKEKMGYPMPLQPKLVAIVMRKLLRDISVMLKWMDEEGFGVDIQRLRKIHPGLMTFGDWLEKQRQFERR